MSNPENSEGASSRPAKASKKKGGEGSISKAIIGKLHIPKKGSKKREDGLGSPEPGKKASKKKAGVGVKLSDQSGKESSDFLKKEADGHTSTPVKQTNDQESPSAQNKTLKVEEIKIPVSPIRKLSPVLDRKSPENSIEDSVEVSKGPEAVRKISVDTLKLEDKDIKEEDDGDTTSMDTATSTEPEVHSLAEIVNRKPPERLKAQSGLKRECLYKILVIGELGTGKTSIIKRYVHQFFSQHYRATIGVDFALKVLNWDQNTIIRLQLWDIAGQERFGNMTRVYYKEAVGAFIVFDVTRAATFDAVVKWKQDLDAKVQLPDGSPIPCVLLANKCDQQKEGLVNNSNKMNEYCEEHKFTAWFETSAKENINIEEAAKTLVDQIVHNDSSNENGRNGARDLSKFPLEASDDFSEGKSCNC